MPSKKNLIKKQSSLIVSENSLIGDVVNNYPESVVLLAQAGLHCIGCHSSGYETIKQGFQVHGLKQSQISKVIKLINERIALYDSLPKLSLTEKAINVLNKKILASGSKYIRIVQVFGSDFDFIATNEKYSNDIEITFQDLKILLDPRTERLLRGIQIDYDLKASDFVVKRLEPKK